MRSAILLSLLVSAEAQAQTSLTLAEAVTRARARHPLVEAQRAQADAARARTEQASASFLPALTGSFAYNPQTPNFVASPSFQRRFLGQGSDVVIDAAGDRVSVICTVPGQGHCIPNPTPPTTFALSSYWSAAVGLLWTPWDWGRSLYAYRSAHAAAGSAQLGVTTSERDVVLAAKLAFFAVIAAEEQVTVADESVATFRTQVDQTRAFQETGLRTRIDVVTAESGLAGAALTLARTRAGVEAARAQLLAALGEERWPGWRLVRDEHAFEAGPVDTARARARDVELAALALRHRTEARALDGLADSYDQRARSLRAQYLPQVTVAAGPEWAGAQLSSLTPNLTISVGLAYPVGGMSPFLVHGEVREAEGGRRATAAQERAAREGIVQEVTTARARLAAALEELVAARDQVAAATAQRDLAIGRYRTGIGTIIELSNALLNDASARLQQVVAGYDLASARAQLQHALGEDS
jgi:outer membrane protein TolC